MKYFKIAVIFLFLSSCTDSRFFSFTVEFQQGSWTGTPLHSEEVRVIEERIRVYLNDSSKLELEIQIDIETPESQTPIILYGSEDFLTKAEASVNGVNVKIEGIRTLDFLANDEFLDYRHLTELLTFGPEQGEWVSIGTEKNKPLVSRPIFISDLFHNLCALDKSFEKGRHQVKIKVQPEEWIDRYDWVRKKHFIYSLRPMTTLKESHPIHLEIDTALNDYFKNYESDIINYVPEEELVFTHSPPVPLVGNVLIQISPMGFTLIALVILIVLHIVSIKAYRRKHISTRFSFVVILGSLIIPFLVLYTAVNSFSWIDLSLGQNASRFHGSVILIYFFYPFFMPAYWTLFWLIDRRIKRSMLSE